jgi:hypothetical protein
MLHAASTGVLLLIAAGLWFRKRNAGLHLRLMISALIADALLALYIEASRHAAEKVVTQVRPLLWFHAAVSVGVLICYGFMVALGRPMLAGKYETRALHRGVGIAFVALRIINYLRRKLSNDASDILIHTIRGAGYRIGGCPMPAISAE